MRIIQIICIVSVFLVSCEDLFLTPIPAPETESKVFVHCVMHQGDSNIKAELRWTKPYFGPVDWSQEFDPVTNAVVKISGNGQTVQLVYDANEEWYNTDQANGFLVPGVVYTLSIEVPDQELVVAQTMMPVNAISEFSLGYDSIIVDPDFGNDEFRFDTKFRDRPGFADYYQISGSYTLDTSSSFDENMQFNPTFFMMSDVNRDGELFEQISRGSYFPEFDYLYFTVYLQAVSRDLYLYRQSINPYVDGVATPGGSFVEPTIVHSNITGGVGIFGASNIRTFHVLKF